MCSLDILTRQFYGVSQIESAEKVRDLIAEDRVPYADEMPFGDVVTLIEACGFEEMGLIRGRGSIIYRNDCRIHLSEPAKVTLTRSETISRTYLRQIQKIVPIVTLL